MQAIYIYLSKGVKAHLRLAPFPPRQVATAVIQPIDMIKVRLQLAGAGGQAAGVPRASAISITRDMLASGRVLDLYTGLSAGLLRQAVYTTARLGFFDTFMGKLSVSAKEQGRTVGFSERAIAGLGAGGLGEWRFSGARKIQSSFGGLEN